MKKFLTDTHLNPDYHNKYSIKQFIFLTSRRGFLLFILQITLLIQLFDLQAVAEIVEIRYENYKISYDSNDEQQAQILLKTLTEVDPKFEDFFNVKIRQLVEIVLPPKQLEFYYNTPANLPAWAHGVYLAGNQKIILKKPGWMTQPEELSRVLAHELSHLYLHQRLSAIEVPAWFDEGMAEYLSGMELNISQGVILANALFAGKWIGLVEVDSMTSFSESQARLAYIESYSAVLFLEEYIRTKGLNWTKYFDIIYDIGFEEALKKVTGQDLLDFEIKWYRAVKEKYQWFIIFNWENIIWLLMILVLFGAMYAVRYRNRRILLKWEAEESVLADADHFTQYTRGNES
jgi:hypothetical protein